MGGFPFNNTELFLPFRLGATARETLQEFIDIDVTAGDLTRILNTNQVYRDLFFRFEAVDRATGAVSTARPAYITMTWVQRLATTARLCVMSR